MIQFILALFFVIFFFRCCQTFSHRPVFLLQSKLKYFLDILLDVSHPGPSKCSYTITRILKQLNNLVSPKHATSSQDQSFILENACKISDLMRKREKFSEALALLDWISKACDQISDAKMKISSMDRCSRAVWGVALSMKRKQQKFDREIVRQAIPILQLLHDKMEQTGTRDIREIAKAQSWCLYYTAACFQYVRKYSNVCHYGGTAINLMQDAFGSDYKKHRVVGLSHAITAEAWESMKSYTYAIEEYLSAIEVFETADDIKSEMYRKSCINCEKSKVRYLRQALFFTLLPKRYKEAVEKKVKDKAETEELISASGQMELVSFKNDE